MKPFNIFNIVGCRPNFIKLAPLVSEMKRHPEVCPTVIHTGQHYDGAMSDVFFRDLDMPRPDVCLNIGPGSEIAQITSVMNHTADLFAREKPDLVVVVGDVSSTVASALAAVKLGLRVAHVEAGLRSFDRAMPEEINRVVTDSISDLLFATEKSAVRNLMDEGRPRRSIHFVGNVMIDTLTMNAEKIRRSPTLERLGLAPRQYAVLTLHRPSNVDSPEPLAGIITAVTELQKRTRVVFPVHPRTRARLEAFGLWQPLSALANLQTLDPLGYIDFMKLVKESSLVLTDSGGVQEESTVLGVPCLTARSNTERPVTVDEGTNRLVGSDSARILEECWNILGGAAPRGRVPEKWDGRASKRIVEIILRELGSKQVSRSPQDAPQSAELPHRAA